MIYYFTGTGNSLDAAMRLREDETESMISIAACVREKNYRIHNTEGERVGFVFPTYFGGLPSMVHHFLTHVVFSETPGYVYIAATCGEKMYAAGRMAVQLLSSETTVHAVYQIPMPDNYIILYTPEEDLVRERRLTESHTLLAQIRGKILDECVYHEDEDPREEKIGFLMYSLYKPAKDIRFFHVDDHCSGCGLCEKRCPASVIHMKNNRPVWTKNSCIQCLSCMRCDKIQFGPFTKGRKRYENPVLQ